MDATNINQHITCVTFVKRELNVILEALIFRNENDKVISESSRDELENLIMSFTLIKKSIDDS